MGAVFALYRHLGELTDILADNPKMKTLKGVTIFNVAVLVVCVLAAILIGTDIWKISENGEKYFAATIVAAVIFFSGNVAPKLPYIVSIRAYDSLGQLPMKKHGLLHIEYWLMFQFLLELRILQVFQLLKILKF